MEQRNDAGSILLSRILVWVFGALILVLDWAVWPLSQVLMRVLPVFDGGDAVLLKVCLYACNVPGFILLYCMDVLLRNLHRVSSAAHQSDFSRRRSFGTSGCGCYR